MKNKQLILLLLLAPLFIHLKCKKESGPQLPPETQIGANTLGFKINGKIYTSRGEGGLLSNESVWGGGHIVILQ